MIGFSTGFERIPIVRFDEIDSTNAEARRRAEQGETGPIWLTARSQTAGRGRRGRAWSSDPGNLAATLLCTSRLPPAQLAELSFVSALCVRAMLREYVPAGLIKFKWPNDVLVAGEKISGILIESGPCGDGSLWVAIGVGVNLSSSPIDVERPATNVGAHLKHEVLAPPAPEAALERLSDAFAKRISTWLRQGFEPFLETWVEGAAGLHGPCTARLGNETIEGVAEGLEPDGALRLRTASGELRRVTAGDVFFAAA